MGKKIGFVLHWLGVKNDLESWEELFFKDISKKEDKFFFFWCEWEVYASLSTNKGSQTCT